ncbi:MAG TPA: Smr/MutS family protein [Kofleriaceae bacterium]|nr:Smr/MutS family protein [Kofleriaceae bacterium]
MGEAVRRPGEEGAELFADAVSGARPLANRERARPPAAPAAGARPVAPPRAGFTVAEDGSHGRAADVSRKTARELAAGKFPPRATLDLHRLTLEAARERVASFIAEARAAGHRSVLIVTGIAERSPAGGRLRDHVPGWLSSGPVAGSVLAFAPARAEHGGAGALYVLLRTS